MELEGSTLVLKRIHVTMKLAAPASQRETAERVHEIYKEGCPIYRSIKAAIDVTSGLEFEPR